MKLTMALAIFVASCSGPTRLEPDAGREAMPDTGPTSPCRTGGPRVLCDGENEVTCEEDREIARRDCRAAGNTCAQEVGCVACVPQTLGCSGASVQRCRADGSGWDDVESCDSAAGLLCYDGACANACDHSASEEESRGCEFWSVVTPNLAVGPPSDFAVIIANANPASVEVAIERGSEVLGTHTIAPGDVAEITLPWTASVSRYHWTTVVRGDAYRLRSTLPIAVFQFSPLEYGPHSNDASLLLPVHALGEDHVIASWPGGFFAVVATSEGTTEVDARFSARTAPSEDGTLPSFEAGISHVFELEQGDVLLVNSWSEGLRHFGGEDLTGTAIRASQPVSVIGGHSCAHVPLDVPSCDHLEESLPPRSTWGREAIVSIPAPSPGEPPEREPHVVRVISDADGNELTFEPPHVHPAVILDRTEFVELLIQEHVQVRGTEPFLVSQYIVGGTYGGPSEGTPGEDDLPVGWGEGDPAMSIPTPTEQFRREYSFLAPSTYTESWVNVTAPTRAMIELDGMLVEGFEPVGDSGYGVARVRIEAGAHAIDGTEPFGIALYARAHATSYMAPGGFNLLTLR